MSFGHLKGYLFARSGILCFPWLSGWAVCPAREGYYEYLGSDGEGIWSIDSVLAFGGRFLARIVYARLRIAVFRWLFLPDTELETTSTMFRFSTTGQSRSSQWCIEYDPGRPRVTWLMVKPLCSSKEVAGMAWVWMPGEGEHKKTVHTLRLTMMFNRRFTRSLTCVYGSTDPSNAW